MGIQEMFNERMGGMGRGRVCTREHISAYVNTAFVDVV